MPKRSSNSVHRAFPWRQSFLSSLSAGANVVTACKAAGISRNSVYTHRRKHAAFSRQWERAFCRGLDARDRAYERAVRTEPEFLGNTEEHLKQTLHH
jgi:hypothetical protein